jgi:carboxyl-terminal processing protease
MPLSLRNLRTLLILILSVSLAGPFPVGLAADEAASAPGADGLADRSSRSTGDLKSLWRRTVELVRSGQFEQAATESQSLPEESKLTGDVRSWLESFQSEQQQRRERNRADFEKYVGYAQERVEREEYGLALAWVRRAAEVAEGRNALLASDWVVKLVEQAVAQGQRYRQERKFGRAHDIYFELKELFDREPRYKKLEREVLTLLRLELVFDKQGKWKERLQHIRLADGLRALDYVDRWYKEPADFQGITASALEELLLLVESKGAREALAEETRIDDEFDRGDFIARLQRNLDQVRSDPAITRREAADYFRRALEINEETVQLPEEILVSELMQGAMLPLDDYTTIIWPAETEEFEKHTRGDFPGVGISIIKNNRGEVEVASPIEDTPAYEAGVLPGDLIVKVDGESIADFSLNQVVKTITGPVDTKVTLTMRRGDREFDLPLVRRLVKIRSVKGRDRDDADPQQWNHWLDEQRRIAYVRVTNFQENTVEDLGNTLMTLKHEGLKGLVLDLRGNPGGLLSSAHQMASLFLQKGQPVVRTKSAIPGEDQDLRVLRDGTFGDFPMVVLVDEHSASASEIVSGALRDNHRATVVGARTFGKFSVQNLINLGRSNAKLKLTTAQYFLPNGDSLHRRDDSTQWGVEPDIAVPLVLKEKLTMYSMRREADRIGPPPTEDTEAEAEADLGIGPVPGDDGDRELDGKDPESRAPEMQGQPRVNEGAPVEGAVPEDPTQPDAEAGPSKPADPKDTDYTWFSLEDVPALQDGTVEIITKGENAPRILIDEKALEVTVADAEGRALKLARMTRYGWNVGVIALDDSGARVPVQRLTVGGDAVATALPPLRQSDPNDRPKIDPQLDAALLFLRVDQVAGLTPFPATAEAPRAPEPAKP